MVACHIVWVTQWYLYSSHLVVIAPRDPHHAVLERWLERSDRLTSKWLGRPRLMVRHQRRTAMPDPSNLAMAFGTKTHCFGYVWIIFPAHPFNIMKLAIFEQFKDICQVWTNPCCVQIGRTAFRTCLGMWRIR